MDTKGTERFVLLVSSDVMIWDDAQWGEFKNHFPQQQGRDFLKQFKEKLQKQRYWGEQTLRIVVK